MPTFVFDEEFSRLGESHAPKPSPEALESPLRVRAIWTYLQAIKLFERADIKTAPPALITEEDVLRVHSPYYLDQVKNVAAVGRGELGRGTPANPDLEKLATKSAGAAARAVEVASGHAEGSRVCFALGRPPGHKAHAQRAEGNCVFNNVAVALERLRATKNFDGRVAIVDFDCHFGAGTSSIYYEDPNVLHVDVHEWGPVGQAFRGSAGEIGAGPGEGTNVNYLVPNGATNEYYLRALDFCGQIIEQFRPKFIVVAMGFDAHWSDPAGNLRLDSIAYLRIGHWLSKLSSKVCGGRVAFVLEGGYSLLVLGRLVEMVLSPFLFNPKPPVPIDLHFRHNVEPAAEKAMRRMLDSQEKKLQEALAPWWKIFVKPPGA
ncbi:MAG: class II histone deacetylase [Promethearchaeota archaeon]